MRWALPWPRPVGTAAGPRIKIGLVGTRICLEALLTAGEEQERIGIARTCVTSLSGLSGKREETLPTETFVARRVNCDLLKPCFVGLVFHATASVGPRQIGGVALFSIGARTWIGPRRRLSCLGKALRTQRRLVQ